MTQFEFISSLVSILAVTLSLVALHRTRKTNARLVELEEIHARLSQAQLDEIEQKEKTKYSAELKVDLDKSSTKQHRLRIYNYGPGTAHEVKVGVTKDNEWKLLYPPDVEKMIPYPILTPGQSFEILATIPDQVSQKVFNLALSWTLENGETEYMECVVS